MFFHGKDESFCNSFEIFVNIVKGRITWRSETNSIQKKIK